ncbi:heme/hemin ABC transporter substrate-binding protein [Pelagibacterium montanilacus]|uniref:heme/hemin ABC transporter substrate-binding protein n=1 Tax=Pelagibacterium montanilacus TaxID=2185280 RepID=UPI001FEB2103|nr:ABC transporter substrate-binding protein [Pelagibacterium montanilacus]
MRPAVTLATAFAIASLGLMAPGASAQTVEPFADASRLVSIGGSLTEIAYELGAADLLVARDTTATYPAEALELPDVGYMRALAPEGVLSVDPSAILALEGAGPIDAIEVLQSASVPIVFVPDRFDAEGVTTKVTMVGEALARTREATALNEELDARFAELAAETAGIADRKSVLFILSMEAGRINASGTGTAADGIIALAGADNAITDYEGYRQLGEEAIIAADPDVILMMDRGGDHGASETDLLAHPAIALTTAGRTGAVIEMDGSYLLGFGPRTADAGYDLFTAIYGNPDPAP